MAGRKEKNTIDYFPHYVTHTKTMHIIEQKYGNDGYSFWFKMLELLGRTEHHIYDMNPIENKLYFFSQVNVSEDTGNEILEILSRLGAIDKELYSQGYVFSENFVANIADAYRKRTTEILKRAEVMQLYGISTAGNINNSAGNTQSKVKESIVKKNPPIVPPRGRKGFSEIEFRDIISRVEILENSKLHETLLEFFEHRRGMKAPLTARASNLLLTKLNELGETDADKIEMLNESILSGWKGVFPRNKAKKKVNNPDYPSAGEAWQMVMAHFNENKPLIEIPETVIKAVKEVGGWRVIGNSSPERIQRNFEWNYNKLLQEG